MKIIFLSVLFAGSAIALNPVCRFEVSNLSTHQEIATRLHSVLTERAASGRDAAQMIHQSPRVLMLVSNGLMRNLMPGPQGLVARLVVRSDGLSRPQESIVNRLEQLGLNVQSIETQGRGKLQVVVSGSSHDLIQSIDLYARIEFATTERGNASLRPPLNTLRARAKRALDLAQMEVDTSISNIQSSQDLVEIYSTRIDRADTMLDGDVDHYSPAYARRRDAAVRELGQAKEKSLTARRDWGRARERLETLQEGLKSINDLLP